MNTQASELNEIIMKNSNTVFELLSERGRKIYFSKKGIISRVIRIAYSSVSNDKISELFDNVYNAYKTIKTNNI